ncbi:MAG TPA: redoxin domain-containing protein [Verrucomicrobiae bacterium]|jgi:peroxiredoxin Q/BCP|nr:redoxin domain-containing protein [Verrucomicrobiae bacterium]
MTHDFAFFLTFSAFGGIFALMALTYKRPDEKGPLPLFAKAPHFSLKDASGRVVCLADFLGKKNVVIVFYPKDKSFTCSRQLASLNAKLASFHDLDTEVLAINPESQKNHASFCDNSHLKFPLLSDPAKKTCRDYRSLGFGGLLANRTVYVIDKQGLVRYGKRGNPPTEEILKSIQSWRAPALAKGGS